MFFVYQYSCRTETFDNNKGCRKNAAALCCSLNYLEAETAVMWVLTF